MNNHIKKRIFPISIFAIIILLIIFIFEFFIIYEGLNNFKFTTKYIAEKNKEANITENMLIKENTSNNKFILDYEKNKTSNSNDKIIINIDDDEPVG